MGVVVLAPNQEMFWGGGSGLDRTDGVAHAAAVNTLIQTQLPKDVAFDAGNVFFTGVSGGSLLMSGFFVPAFGAQYKTGVVLNCGAMAPQVDVVDAATLAASMKIHFQSTQDELALLQESIPQSVAAYEQLATDAGLSADQIGALQTVDNTPNGGGHCAFDGKDFVSGVQLISDNYSNILGTNPSGEVTDIGNVLTVSVHLARRSCHTDERLDRGWQRERGVHKRDLDKHTCIFQNLSTSSMTSFLLFQYSVCTATSQTPLAPPVFSDIPLSNSKLWQVPYGVTYLSLSICYQSPSLPLSAPQAPLPFPHSYILDLIADSLWLLDTTKW